MFVLVVPDMVKCFYDLQLNRILLNDFLVVDIGRLHCSCRGASCCISLELMVINELENLLWSESNLMSVMNTWFQKRFFRRDFSNFFLLWDMDSSCNEMYDWLCDIHGKSTQHRYCFNAQVMRGVTCWTGHKLVRVKLNLHCCGPRHVRRHL